MARPAGRSMRVVVVEDSLVQRRHLVKVLQHDGDIDVVGEAEDAKTAVVLVEALRPDVVTLDLNIPGGGGHQAIEQIMAHRPTPILVLSATVADRSSAPAVEALVAGALDVLPKPGRWTAENEADIRRAVRAIRGATVLRHPRGHLNRPVPTRAPQSGRRGSDRVVAIAASTGGPTALVEVLSGLAAVDAPVLVVQHLHPEFVEGLVSWLARTTPLPVRLAADGDVLIPGTVFIGPGGTHLTLGPGRRIRLDPSPDTIHRPSADVLFSSVAEQVGSAAVGVILTGMGADGAAGILKIRQAGGATIGQDEASCAVFGMPRAAARLDALDALLPLGEIAGAIVRAQQPVTR